MRKNTILLFLFNVINSVSQFGVVMILSRFMPQDLYGTYRQVFLPFEISAPILGWGLTSTIFYFHPRFESPQRVLQVGLGLILTTCLIFQFLLFAGLNDIIVTLLNNPQVSDHIDLLGLFAVLSLSNTLIYTYFILQGEVSKSLVINFLVNMMYVLSLYLMSDSSLSLEVAIYLRIIAYGSIFFLMIFISGAWKKVYDSVQQYTDDFVSVAKHSFPVALSLTIGVLSYQVDKFLVSYLSTPDQYALYINGAFEVPLITMVTSSIAGATFGLFSNYCKEKQFKESIALFGRVCHISALILFPSFVFLMFFADHVIIALFGKNYSDSASIFRIYLCLLPIRIVQYGNVLIALNKAKTLVFRSVIELLLGVTIAATAYFVVGISGVALGMVSSVLFWTVPYNLREISIGLNSSIGNLIPWRALTKTAIFSGLSGVIVFISMESIAASSPFPKLAYSICMFSLIYTATLFTSKALAIEIKGGIRIKLN